MSPLDSIFGIAAIGGGAGFVIGLLVRAAFYELIERLRR